MFRNFQLLQERKPLRNPNINERAVGLQRKHFKTFFNHRRYGMYKGGKGSLMIERQDDVEA